MSHPINTFLILNGANETRKKQVNVYSLQRTVAPFQGHVEIVPPSTERSGRTYIDVLFTPDTECMWWHFSLSPCFPVDGAVTCAVIPVGPNLALTITQMSSCAVIKRRNLLSRKIEILTFHQGREIDGIDATGQTPTTLVQPEPCLTLRAPEPTEALVKRVKEMLRMSRSL